MMKKLLSICLGSLISVSANADMLTLTNSGNLLKKWHQASIDYSLDTGFSTAFITPNHTNVNTKTPDDCDGANCEEKVDPCNFGDLNTSDERTTASQSQLDGIKLAFEENLGAIELLFFDLLSDKNEDPELASNETKCDNMLISADISNGFNGANGSSGFNALSANDPLFGPQLGLLASSLKGDDTNNDGSTLTNTKINAVPLPATALLFSSALLGFVGNRYRKIK